MKIIWGKHAGDLAGAAAIALQEAGIDSISADVIGMFAGIVRDGRIENEADKLIGSALRNKYGNKSTWRAERWFVPVPKLHYQGKEVPQLIIEISVYVVAAAIVNKHQDSRTVTLAGAVGKPETMAVPMILLHALLENDLRRFAIVERDAVYTTWEIPGAKPVRLPNNFIRDLEDMLACQSVVGWLEEFGYQGIAVAPLVTGNLLGLMFQDLSSPLPLNEETVTTENLINVLEGLAYKPAEAQEMVRRAAPQLSADITLEEAIRITLKPGKGGD